MDEQTPLVGSSLTIIDRNGKPRILAGFTPNNDAIFALRDSSGMDRVSISVDADGRPKISLCDGDGAIRIQVSAADETLGPNISIGNNSNQVQLCLHLVQPTGFPAVTLSSPEEGGYGMVIGITSEGKPVISGTDATGLRLFKID